MKNHYPKGYGWIHADGTVGANAITQKWPTMIELVTEWILQVQNHFLSGPCHRDYKLG